MILNIAWLGTGLMGEPMALRLHQSHYRVTAWNRTAAKLAALQAAGVATATDLLAAIQRAEVILLTLSDATAIQEVLSESILARIADRTVIQMGTIAPGESRAIGDRILQAGGQYLEAPVLGSIPEARSGQLIVMVGSTPEQFQQWRSLLQNFGPEPFWIGPVGTAATLKLCLNQLIASLTTSFALSLRLIQHQGIDPETWMAILRQSALYAPTFDKKLSRMVQDHYANPNFPTRHLLKDMALFRHTANAAGLDTSMISAIEAILQRAMQQGLADADYAALASVLGSS